MGDVQVIKVIRMLPAHEPRLVYIALLFRPGYSKIPFEYLSRAHIVPLRTAFRFYADRIGRDSFGTVFP